MKPEHGLAYHPSTGGQPMSPVITAPARDIPVLGGYDVVVCGGGPAGCAAATAAARQGLRALLVEGQGQLGGMGTSGLVSHWLGGRSYDCKSWVVGGIFRELTLRAVRQGIALMPDVEPEGKFSPHGWCRHGAITAGIPFDPFAMAALLDDVMAEAGVEVRLCTEVVDTVVKDGAITHAILHNKSGLQAVAAKAFIDATGDADVAARSGCDTVLGREEDRRMTPVTLQVQMDHIDAEAHAAYANAHGQGGSFRFLDEIQQLIKTGEWPFEYNRLISVQLSAPDTFMVNTSRLVGFDGTDGASVSKAMAQGRRESWQLLAILRKHVPGFKNARIKAVATLLGVRETRRIIGAFVLRVQDFVDDVPFPDVIGQSAYGWDLPTPERPSDNPDVGRERGVKRTILPIPYRIMLPRPMTNLICPGRSVSVERDVLGPLRVMAPCMAMGEAAGTAAAQVVQKGSSFSAVCIPTLRAELQRHGAILDGVQAVTLPSR
ncbi:MAG: FAD-dependent oxidoreductase, partial [Chloroflexi bacterium]|nr:FAD-dependent oxidoreductase [Chloroflexota bacterium]